jgi:hypothetical protein
MGLIQPTAAVACYRCTLKAREWGRQCIAFLAMTTTNIQATSRPAKVQPALVREAML